MDAGTQISHGDFPKKLSQKIIASPQTETYSASISINRPFSIIPMFVIQMRAAMTDPPGPRLARATVTNATATASTITADGRRAVHSLRTPKIRKDAATSQFTRGGFWKYGFPPTSGTM
jgi:hypothetical protein